MREAARGTWRRGGVRGGVARSAPLLGLRLNGPVTSTPYRAGKGAVGIASAPPAAHIACHDMRCQGGLPRGGFVA